MINQTTTDGLNGQINKEFYSAYFYLALSAKCEELSLRGGANWFMAKYHEEMAHAMKFYRYVLDQGAEIELQTLVAPTITATTLTDMFEQTLAHEKAVTQSITELFELAQKGRDHATQIFLQWFVTEQIEEEASVSEILSRIRLVDEASGPGLFMMDKELAEQAAQNPAAQIAPPILA